MEAQMAYTGCMGGLAEMGACMQCMIRCHETHRVWELESFAACARCTSDCNSASTLPFFFKYVSLCMQSTYCRPAMEVPYDFAKMHITDAVCHVELKAPDGKLWLVKIRCEESKCTLLQGWKEFAAGHQLARGDAMLFQLISKVGSKKCQFAVKLFKQKASLTSNQHANVEINLLSETCRGQNKCRELIENLKWGSHKKARCAGREMLNAHVKSKSNDNGTEDNANHVKPNCDLSKHKQYPINKKGGYIRSHANMQVKLCAVSASKKQENAAPLNECVIGSDLLFSGITYARRKAVVQAMAKIATCTNGKKCSMKKNVHQDDQKLANALKCSLGVQMRNIQFKIPQREAFPHNESNPKYPRFFKTMFATNVGSPFVVNIPRIFSVSHMDPMMKKTCYDMKLVLGTGRRKTSECKLDQSYRVVCTRKYRYNGNGVMVLNKGWKEFVCRNKLKVGDVCMFELVEPLTFMLHIIAAVKSTCKKPPVQSRLLSSL